VRSLLILLCLSLPAFGLDYYVSSAGNNSNDGLTTGTSWLTIAKAITNLAPGVTVNLNGGDTFNEDQLYVRTSGTDSSPVRFTSYGTGRGIIKSLINSNNVFTILSSSNVQIDNLVFTGRPNIPYVTNLIQNISIGFGVMFVVTNTSGRFDGCTVSNCLVTNVTNGVGWDTSNTNAIFANPRIVGCSVSNALGSCVWFGASSGTAYGAITNLYIGNNKLGDCSGDTNLWYGIPVFVRHSVNSLMEYNYLFNSGKSCGNFGGGAGGLVLQYSSGFTAQYNEAYKIGANVANVDGIGFDFDTACTNCTFQYNYAHGCDGPGFYFFGSTYGGNVARWNLSVSNNILGLTGEFQFFNANHDWKVYNNTIRASDGKSAIYFGGSQTGTNYLVNNIIYSSGGKLIDSVAAQTTINVSGNDYWQDFFTVWGNVTNTTLAGFRTTSGQETGTGLTIDPLFISNNEEMLNGSAYVTTLVNQRLRPYSGCLRTGQLLSNYGISSPGTNDLFGFSLYTPYPIGAYAGPDSPYVDINNQYTNRRIAKRRP